LRVLVAGWLNSPHVTGWADAVAAAGHEVHLAGRAVAQWPPPEDRANVHMLRADGPPLLRSLRMGSQLHAVARQVGPDLVHAHWLPEFGWLAAREGLHPLVCSAWGSDVFGVRGHGKRRSRRALAAAELVFADSADLARETRMLAARDVRVEVVRSPLDGELFAPGNQRAAREALGLPDTRLVVSMRGLGPIYNPVLLLEAFALVLAAHRDVRLVLKRPGGETPREVTAIVDRLGLSDAVIMLGSVSLQQMPDIYRSADVVVSVPSSDSSPRSVWEAFACGRPVVVSDLPWAREELEDGRHALLAELEPDAIAASIGRVLDEAELAHKLGTESRALAMSELDPRRWVARIDDLYRSVTGSRR
jgi:glycosyltransferase involved in cell wall biosynthesis